MGTNNGKLRINVIFIFTAILCFAACSSTPRVSLIPRVGILDLKGDLKVGSGKGRVTATSDARKLGLEDEVAFQPRLSLDWDNLHIAFATAGVEFTGVGKAKTVLNVGSIKAGGDIPVRSDLEASYIATEVLYDIPPIRFIDVGVGFGLGAASYDVALTERTLGTRLEADDTTIFGYVAGRIAKDIGPFSFILHLSGLALEPKDWELEFRDIDFNASYRLFGIKDQIEARILIGYRYLSLDYKFRDEDIRIKTDARLRGPFSGLVISF